MPRRYPNEIRRQVVELARSGTKVAPRMLRVAETSRYSQQYSSGEWTL